MPEWRSLPAHYDTHFAPLHSFFVGSYTIVTAKLLWDRLPMNYLLIS